MKTKQYNLRLYNAYYYSDYFTNNSIFYYVLSKVKMAELWKKLDLTKDEEQTLEKVSSQSSYLLVKSIQDLHKEGVDPKTAERFIKQRNSLTPLECQSILKEYFGK